VTSICGPVESQALCRRPELLEVLAAVGFRSIAMTIVSTRSEERPRNV
jgi:hypothetical protein